MMAVNVKRLNEAEIINLDRCYAESDKQMKISRRQQALLAAAGQSEPHRRWYVLRVADHSENDVDKLLTQAGIETWIPREKRVRNAPHAKRKIVREVLAFPGYMFVKVHHCDETWSGLLNLEGVHSVLGGGYGPVPIHEAKMLEFKKKLAEKSTDAEVLEEAFPIGATVLIEEGPFAGYNGTIDAVKEDEQRATILVALFGRFTPVELTLAQITKSD